MKPSDSTMRQAMRLMQAGDLQAATRTLQHALRGGAGAGAGAPAQDARARHEMQSPVGGVRGEAAARGPCIEGEFRVVDGGKARRGETPSGIPGARAGRHRFACDAGELEYRLHVPAGLDTAGAPLLVMLHGCTQTPEDFARGTRMDRLASGQGYVVAWPAQSAERNPNRCWNWFRGSDQQRGQGEPAIIAALTRQLVAIHRLDADRVYVAGLSAGGAMAAVLASTYPDVYAAIGVHSGLPIGLASDVPSAFAAMRKGGGRSRGSATGAALVPAIVFHGDSDTTVHPGNGQGVVEQSLASGGADGVATSSSVERVAGARSSTRTVHRMADGRIAAEHWVIHGAGHAWSGGDTAGTYTDPQGPDASARMLEFFSGCRRAGH